MSNGVMRVAAAVMAASHRRPPSGQRWQADVPYQDTYLLGGHSEGPEGERAVASGPGTLVEHGIGGHCRVEQTEAAGDSLEPCESTGCWPTHHREPHMTVLWN